MTTTKRCTKCKINLDLVNFSRQSASKDGLSAWCKICRSNYARSPEGKLQKLKWRNSKSGKEYHTEYNNRRSQDPFIKGKKIKAQKLRRRTDPNRKLIDKRYAFNYNRREEVKALRNAKRRELRKTSMEYRVQERLRGRLKDLLGRSRPESVSKSMGCTLSSLLAHLESKFKPGMSWDNYGFYGWHIDHIVPLAAFDLTNLEQYRAACHYTNLQPLWAAENMSKGAKVA